MRNGPQSTTKTPGVAKPADWLLWSFERRCLQRPAVLSVLLSPVFRLLYSFQLLLASVLLFVLGIPTRSISNQFSRRFDLQLFFDVGPVCVDGFGAQKEALRDVMSREPLTN